VRVYLAIVARLSLLFAVVYGGCAWLTARLEHASRLYFEWEQAIPLLPAMVYVYFSIAAVFLLPLFTLDETGLRRLEHAFAWATLLAGACFLVLNAQLGFERGPTEPMNRLAAAMYASDPPRNLVPSLHVLYAALVLRTVAAACRPRARAALAVWFFALAGSTLLVHQHHVIDVVTGALAGWIAAAWTIRDPTRSLCAVPSAYLRRG
jgi:membrane-associated phospholipid phosphatase